MQKQQDMFIDPSVQQLIDSMKKELERTRKSIYAILSDHKKEILAISSVVEDMKHLDV